MSLLLEGVGKAYGDRWAVRDVNLDIESGLVGLVGPNGAGKTTLMRMVATLLPATTGRIVWAGFDAERHGPEIRRTLGYLPQDFGVYPELTGRAFLQYMAAMKRMPQADARTRVEELLEVVGLRAEAGRRLNTYSGGMKQRIGIAQALLNDPRLLIVDEPTAGLDPAERVRFRALLARVAADRVVILSTHIIGDVEAAASRLLVMREGHILADTDPEGLIAQAVGRVWSVETDTGTAARLQMEFPVSGLISRGRAVAVRVIADARPVSGASPADPTLEDAYLAVINSLHASLAN